MKEEYNLIDDLEKLSNSYNELTDDSIIPTTEEHANKYNDNLIKSGELIIDFFDSFMSKYSFSPQDGVIQSYELLHNLSILAKDAIKNKNYFALSVLQIPMGSKINDPNRLEKLIINLKK